MGDDMMGGGHGGHGGGHAGHGGMASALAKAMGPGKSMQPKRKKKPGQMMGGGNPMVSAMDRGGGHSGHGG